ncbi:MAG: hypothetical protein N3I35_16755 [Clostridia bacterium]|nr:hypothetical protein [Clostridia bacterium]
MIIKHISILNLDKSVNNSIEGGNLYSMRVYLSDSPGRVWKERFNLQWRKMFFFKKKKLYFSNNEIRLFLEKQDDLQKYVESLKDLVDRTNKMTDIKQHKERKELRRKLRINLYSGVKVYKVVG